MKIYKLRYTNREDALLDLISKKVYIENTENDVLAFGDVIKAVVEIGSIVSEYPTFNEEGEELTELVYFEGYHFDVMSSKMITFENSIQVNNPKHKFFGVK